MTVAPEQERDFGVLLIPAAKMQFECNPFILVFTFFRAAPACVCRPVLSRQESLGAAKKFFCFKDGARSCACENVSQVRQLCSPVCFMRGEFGFSYVSHNAFHRGQLQQQQQRYPKVLQKYLVCTCILSVETDL